MTTTASLRFRTFLVLALAATLGGAFGLLWNFLFPNRAYFPPLPHHFPKYPGGITLRFAMVHDVLHERYGRHSKEYYAERNREVREAIETQVGEKLPEGDFPLFDDLGVGLDSVGQHDVAVQVMRDKLQRQLRANLSGRQLYTTYANLGTFLVHANTRKAIGGDKEAKDRLQEGLSFVKKSIEVNPEAHFGREVWQAVIVEFMLACIDKPELLLKYDMIGDLLIKSIDPVRRRSNDVEWTQMEHPQGLRASLDDVRVYRKRITFVGGEGDWAKDVPSSQPDPVAFDEPTLGIVGMWRLGGGANPHFALALGEIMTRVGQRYIAWCAYERAQRLAERFSKDLSVQKEFIGHCQRQQSMLVAKMPVNDAYGRKQRFDAELQYGLDYQKAYANYEADQIRAGVPLDHPSFYVAFNQQHGPIESPVGEEERAPSQQTNRMPTVANVILFAGIFALVAALLLRGFDALSA
jgi:hypothetical protein